jgi:hypothetical protein
MEKIEALSKFLNVTAEDLTEDRDNSFSCGREEYLVLTDEEADEAVEEYIKDSLWAFNASFILDCCGLPHSGGEESLKTMQEKSCEGANDFILALVEKTCGLQEFVEEAIAADGRGHFLSSYDGEEVEEGDYFIYRTN